MHLQKGKKLQEQVTEAADQVLAAEEAIALIQLEDKVAPKGVIEELLCGDVSKLTAGAMKDLETELTADKDLDEEALAEIARVKQQVVTQLKQQADSFQQQLQSF
eukprot:5503434-Pyramimonas_sp.AAC.1